MIQSVQSAPTQILDVEATLRRVLDTRFDPPWDQELRATIPQLAALLGACHDRPMDDLVAMIREILLERCQLDEGGDALFHDTAALAEAALMLAHELERLRCQGVHRGWWSSAAAPPPMCG